MTSKPILYVEDDKNDILFMQQIWKDAEVCNPLITVPDGQAAMDYLEGQGPYADRNLYPIPGLLLLDLNLPRKNGLEVLRWVRQHQVFHTLPVVVFTSSNRDIDVYKSYALGANAFVVKPAMMDELLAAVKGLKDFWLGLNQPPPDLQFPANNHSRPCPANGK